MSSDPPLPGKHPQPANMHPAQAHIDVMPINSSIPGNPTTGPSGINCVSSPFPFGEQGSTLSNIGSVGLPIQPALTAHYRQHHGPPQLVQPIHVQTPCNQQVDLLSTNYATTTMKREYIDEPMDAQDMNGGDPGGMSQHDGSHQVSDQFEHRLKVEDALSYLDQVRFQFGGQPQVYNDFLDIMKEFKSQSIDTPDVVTRVSELFSGHPELILGFNAFLPAGYKIEVSMNLPGQGLGGYAVKTVHAGSEPVFPSQQPAVIVPQESIIQPGPPMTHSNHGTPTRPIFPLPNIPQPTNLSAASCETNPAPPFTHSFSSPFVQSTFPASQTQPVEFSHAIIYVNKIKSRFQGQPERYKQFLEILHTYQREQRSVKEGASAPSKLLTENEVYNQVAKLFEGQEDLLQEFRQFLPDATNNQSTTVIDQIKTVKVNREIQPAPPKSAPLLLKRPSIQNKSHQPKKMKPVVAGVPDIPLAEAGKYGTLNEFALFDMIRVALNNSQAYEGFLRCLRLYNDEIVNKIDLLTLVQPFLAKHKTIFTVFKNFVMESNYGNESVIPTVPERSEKLTDEQIMEIDFSSCRRLGASYCALPSDHLPPVCSGRTQLEKEVLNDVWVSFPTWSEDSTFVNSRKTSYEEFVYNCEDERYELDAVIETNFATIQTLNNVVFKMEKMDPDELKRFRLDDTFGGTSQTICQRAIRRLYGDKATEMLEAMKSVPKVAIPLVLKRLEAKHIEWSEAKKGYNKVWHQQMKKFYLKSLDHQGVSFKQSDMRMLRPKALVNQIETLLEERQESHINESTVVSGNPHLSLQYGDRSVLTDACNLLLHHVRRQSGIQKEDKKKVKQILKHFMFDIFHHERLALSDDEAEVSPHHESSNITSELIKTSRNGNKKKRSSKKASKTKAESDSDSHGNHGSSSVGNQGQGHKVSAQTEASRRSQKKSEPSKSYHYVEGRTGPASKNRDKPVTKTQRQKADVKEFCGEIDAAITALSDTELVAAYNEFKAHEVKQELARQEMYFGEKAETDKHSNEEEAYVLFYSNRSWYIFLRLHNILCERLSRILEITRNIIAEELVEGRPSSSGPAIKLKLQEPREIEPEEYYPNFLEMIKHLLDGNLDAGTFEDTVRERFGIQAYISYTLGKVIINAVRQLQLLVTDDASLKCLDLYHRHHKKGGAGGAVRDSHDRVAAEITYRKSAEKCFENDGCTRVMIYKNAFRMSMELLSTEKLESAAKQEQETKMFFLSKIIRSTSKNARQARAIMNLKPLFLDRNFARVKKNKPRGEHDYIAREYHHGNIPKYYCPKELVDQTLQQDDWDIELDLLHYPEKYKYLYDKDIMIIIVVPPEFVSIPSVVRNALIQRPIRTFAKRDKGVNVAKARKTKFDRWHQVWRKHCTTREDCMAIDSWFMGSDSNLILPELVNLPQAPFRTVKKYVSASSKQREFYAFPTKKERISDTNARSE